MKQRKLVNMAAGLSREVVFENEEPKTRYGHTWPNLENCHIFDLVLIYLVDFS